jgi:Asp-tRNA(Asn)/Glu-tRNA(Gln) amidotransferase A subunit family amidase
VNNVVGLRPTYGRVSRFGAMALSWTMDKIGPMCRSVEDCALVFNAIYGPDGRDDTVVDAPFEWNPDIPLSKLRIGYVKSEFEEQPPEGRGGGRGRGGLTAEQLRAQDEARVKALKARSTSIARPARRSTRSTSRRRTWPTRLASSSASRRPPPSTI